MISRQTILLITLLVVGCEENPVNDTKRDIYSDDIADVTYLNGLFFTTNYDLSANAGSQIDLMKFNYENNTTTYIDDSYDLNMNGQGYLALDNDGVDLYLQSRISFLLIKSSAIGEHINIVMDTISSNWQPSGITFQSITDSIVTIYRNMNELSQYRARTISKDLSFSSVKDVIFNFDFIDTTHYGVYAIESKGSLFFMLGADTTQTDILIITNNSFEVTALDTIPDSTVVGLCFKDNDLFLSYRNRKIEQWKTY